MSHRVLLAGLFHETHTFLDVSTPLSDWTILRGDELFEARGDASPLAGVLSVADDCGWQVTPTIDMRATPGGPVDDEVLEIFWDGLAAGIQAGPFDGIYLVLHGAMACRGCPDVEGEVIRRIRAIESLADLPICGVLDLHGNISRETIEQTQGLISYRCNPHTDGHQVAVESAQLLDKILSSKRTPQSVWARPPVMWPPTGTGTDDDPMKTLEQMARQIEAEEADIVAVNVMGGFSFADTPDTGVSFAATTFGDPDVASARLAELVDHAIAARQQGNIVDPPLASCLDAVDRHIAEGDTPVVLVEPSDNIGGGAPGDATTMLAEFITRDIDGAVAIINDPESVQAVSNLDTGAAITLSIGGKTSRLTDGPLELTVTLESTSDGRFTLEDPHSHLASGAGLHIQMGPCAVVRCGGVRILLTTLKTPPFDLGQLRSQGIAPEDCSVVNVKAAVAHRQGWDPVTARTYTVDTPGPCSSDISRLPFKLVNRPVFPLDELESSVP
ncbi:M81 family metallopeptidase [Planctomycetaceae bacterium]|nr:M81 family metallopeptidase [Planctomycetaceae bacterium]